MQKRLEIFFGDFSGCKSFCVHKMTSCIPRFWQNKMFYSVIIWSFLFFLLCYHFTQNWQTHTKKFLLHLSKDDRWDLILVWFCSRNITENIISWVLKMIGLTWGCRWVCSCLIARKFINIIQIGEIFQFIWS